MASSGPTAYYQAQGGGNVQFRILGPVEVAVDGEPIDLGPRKQRSLFALLLIHHNRVVSSDRILDELWGEEAEGKENALWVYISRLRAALGEVTQESILVTRDHGYSLVIDPELLDAHEFERLAKQGSNLLQADPEAAARDLTAALAIWRGHALEDFTYDEFARSEITRLEELRAVCLENRIESDLKRGLSGELIGELELIVDERPLDERPVSQLMLAQYRAGRQADALRCFERFRRGIGEELGLEPSPELRRLEEQILLHDSRLQPKTSERTPARAGTGAQGHNPFRGLEAFREEDANLFFGRDRLVTDILKRLDEHAIVSLVGSSGCGKSSATRSGVIPAIRKGAIPHSDSWLIAQMVPGSHPFAELEAALLRSTLDAPNSLKEQLDGAPDEILRAVLRILPADDSRVIIVVDQFEELFTLCDPDTSDRFLTALVEAAADSHGRVRVMITLRADFYDRPLAHPQFGNAMGAGIVNVVPMAPEELEQAASQPALRAGVRLDPGLEAALIGDVLGEPGALPLFQFALTDLFDRRVGDTLTLGAYREMGGIQGTLSRKAEQLYARLTEEQQIAARQVFLRLVALSDSETRSRRRVDASELLALELDVTDLQAVLQAFGQQRLLSFDRNDVTGSPTVEVAHEALLEHWDRLADWIDDGMEDVRHNIRLTAAATEWNDNGRTDGYLLTGTRLKNYEGWASISTMSLARTERQYLDASAALRDDQLAADQERASREAASARKAKRNAFGLVALIAAVIAVGGYFLWTSLQPEGPTIAWLQPVDAGTYESLVEEGIARAERKLDFVPIIVSVSRDPVEQMRQVIDDGAELVVSGFAFTEAVAQLAPDHREVQFVLFDSDFRPDEPNVSLVTIDIAEAAYLMGVAAASVSRNGAIGFIGSTQNDFFNDWLSAYEAGARDTDDSVAISASWISDRFEGAFDNPDSAYEIAMQLFDQGVDVIFTAAGRSGEGTMRAASDFSRSTGRHVWAIGVDSDEGFLAESDLKPFVLTSLIKSVDSVMFDTIGAFLDRRLEPEMVYRMSDGAAGYSTFGGHIDAMRFELDTIGADLESGSIDIPKVTALPSTWLEPGARELIATFDGESCVLSTAPEIFDGEDVDITFVNETDQNASMTLATSSISVSTEMYRQKLAERGNAFEAMADLTIEPINWWTVPPNSSYLLRAAFQGAPLSVGVVVCWVPNFIAGSFNVLDN
jgi:basic membrane lipoprotein Med (substrate-binding protein (PBP1-ABC) superfamily)/DNA-binding SARP family transcriptional activator